VDQPLEKIGRVAYAQLQKLMDKQEPEMRNILLEARLIRRQST
jgi:DNA-binding LacI/PurR family transcriptional regulator